MSRQGKGGIQHWKPARQGLVDESMCDAMGAEIVTGHVGIFHQCLDETPAHALSLCDTVTIMPRISCRDIDERPNFSRERSTISIDGQLPRKNTGVEP